MTGDTSLHFQSSLSLTSKQGKYRWVLKCWSELIISHWSYGLLSLIFFCLLFNHLSCGQLMVVFWLAIVHGSVTHWSLVDNWFLFVSLDGLNTSSCFLLMAGLWLYLFIDVILHLLVGLSIIHLDWYIAYWELRDWYAVDYMVQMMGLFWFSNQICNPYV